MNDDTIRLALALVSAGFAIAGVAWLITRARLRRVARHAAALERRRHATFRRLTSLRTQLAGERQSYLDHLREQSAAVVCVTPEGRIERASKAMVAMLGYDSEAELCSLPAEIMYANPSERATRVLAPLEESGTLRNVELEMRRRDGVRCRALASIRVTVGPDGARLHEAAFTDITEWHRAVEQNQRLAEQLHVAQKLEAVGRLASGIAHEINTPVHFLIHNLHFLREAFDELTSRHAALELLAAADESAETRQARAGLGRALAEAGQVFEESFEGLGRVAETVQAMKDFAHPGDGEMAMADLNHAINTTIIVSRNEYKHVADLTTDLADLPSVVCRLGDIKKVLLNLIVNAAHALEARPPGSPRGTIHVETRGVEDEVVVRVSDSGCGIPKAVIERIFDPFFTTKTLGKGTGQGLAIARSVMQSHGGSIDVASRVGVGTTFTLRLPIYETASTGTNLFEESAEEGIS
ncbi:MAG TPA: ATP-binding protein [Steroidobacteraceae bacterium]|nr:ATP-binding protein [Steroidobacteraceae bacterium]